MKKHYYLIMVLAFFYANIMQAQFAFPETLGNQSTTTTIHFKILAGNCFYFPSQVQVLDVGYDETFNLTTCNGTNLKYNTSGLSLPDPLSFTAVFLGQGIAEYENGALKLLSNSDIELNEMVSIYPNPLIKEKQLTLKFARNLKAKVFMYNVKGKLTTSDEVNNVKTKLVNTSALTNGIYFMRIATNEASITRKVIIMN